MKAKIQPNLQANDNHVTPRHNTMYHTFDNIWLH